MGKIFDQDTIERAISRGILAELGMEEGDIFKPYELWNKFVEKDDHRSITKMFGNLLETFGMGDSLIGDTELNNDLFGCKIGTRAKSDEPGVVDMKRFLWRDHKLVKAKFNNGSIIISAIPQRETGDFGTREDITMVYDASPWGEPERELAMRKAVQQARIASQTEQMKVMLIGQPGMGKSSGSTVIERFLKVNLDGNDDL